MTVLRPTSLFGVALVALASATAALAGAQSAAPVTYAPADIAYGAKLYDAQCTTCHGANGDGVGGVELKTGKFRNAVSDQDLVRIILNGIPGTGMLAFRFEPGELEGIVAYLRNMNTFDRGSVTAGDAGRGRALFEGKGDCARCHRATDRGARVAPDLSDIGARRSPSSLARSLVDPTSQMMPINRPVRAVTRDGQVITGRRLNEDTYTVQLLDDRERLVSLVKADLRDYTIGTTSPMPSYERTLSADERADLVAYLLSLKGR